MRSSTSYVIAIVVCSLAISLFASPAAAQQPGPPGQPQVAVNGNSVTVSWTWPQTGGTVSHFLINAIYNGVVVAGSPFNVNTMTSVAVGPLPSGTYTISITAVNPFGTNTSFSTTFALGGGVAPGVPALATPVVSGNTVSFQWSAVAGATGYQLSATITATGQNLTLPVGNQTYFVVNQVPPGSYVVSLRALNAFGASGWSTPQTIVVGGLSLPGTPTFYQPTVTGQTVVLRWDPPTSGGGQTYYEIEALIQSTGQIITLPVDASQTSVTVPGVPAGNFIVKMRARNVLGAGPWTAERIVVVGVTLISGDLQVTLTWNTTVDMDLHVREPNGTHVYFGSRTGTSARLDVDDTNGYGPENIYVLPGSALAGTYEFYIVQWGSMATPTTSTIAVRLYPGTANERTAIFARTTAGGSSTVGYNVANVNIQAGTIAETTGTRVADQREAVAVKPAEVPQAAVR